MIKLKTDTTEMVLPDIGDISEWGLVAHGDAGIKSMPDKQFSVAGHVVMMMNMRSEKTCILSWRSKKIKRKVSSSLAGETLAMVETIGEVVYTRAVLEQVYGGRMRELPAVIFTDSNNLYKSIYSTKLVNDPWLIPDVAAVKEALEEKVVTEVRLVPGDQMLANCLTKAGASGDSLLKVLRTGIYRMPGGWR